MLRITTINFNGIRSAGNKGFFQWIDTINPSIVCGQEVKASLPDISQSLAVVTLGGRAARGHFSVAEKKGYSGVVLYSATEPLTTQAGYGSAEFDSEGRYVRADFEKFSVISIYLPSGASGPERQEAKFRFLAEFTPHLQGLMDEHRRTGREFVLCADWNIAHHNIDLKNWKSNQKNSGFLPEERAWMTQVQNEIGWIDVFRRLHPALEQYTWWSNRGAAWEKNVGWRLDYQLATPGIAATAQSASVWTQTRFSDHAPLTIDYDFEFK